MERVYALKGLSMANFDADAHVEESTETWKYLDEKFSRRQPVPVTLEDQPALLGQNSFWLIDGGVVPRTSGKGLSLFGTPTTSRHAREKPFAVGSQELTDIDARLRDLDRFGIETQVVNSTLLNATLTPDIEFEYALCRAYNSWIHEVCSRSSERLRWNAMIRLTQMERAVAELRRVAQLGAAAAEIHGMAGDRLLDSRDFDPFWAEAEKLNMPVYVHIGFESPTFTGLFQNLFLSIAFSNRASLLMGFLAIVGTGVAERCPRLRFAFAEAGVEWLPWLVRVMDSYWRMGEGIFKSDPGFGHSKIRPSEILRDGNIFMVCEEDEDLREPLKILGGDRMMLGSDMPHSESHPNSFQKFKERTDLSQAVKKSIMGETALRFFSR
jgi:predicted TIM-barrel fold metal-dependent hydrolase